MGKIELEGTWMGDGPRANKMRRTGGKIKKFSYAVGWYLQFPDTKNYPQEISELDFKEKLIHVPKKTLIDHAIGISSLTTLVSYLWGPDYVGNGLDRVAEGVGMSGYHFPAFLFLTFLSSPITDKIKNLVIDHHWKKKAEEESLDDYL